jgi:hypothetical protein
MQTPSENVYIGIRRAALYTGKSAATIRRALKVGALRGYRVGLGAERCKRLTFTREDLDRWMLKNPIEPATERAA